LARGDITNRTEPSLDATLICTDGSGASHVATSGALVYVWQSDRLSVVWRDTQQDWKCINGVAGTQMRGASGLSVNGSRLAVAQGDDGWQMWDVGDPTRPQALPLSGVSTWPAAVIASSAALVLTAGGRADALRIYEQPFEGGRPRLLQSLGGLDVNAGLFVSGPHIYALSWHSGLSAVQMSR
jgi:hypothetical protein